MNKEMICKNCKYHYIEEISFDYPQSCCSKRMATTEEWCKCNDFEYSDRYIKQLQQENKELVEQLEEYKLQNVSLRADVMIKKKAFPNKFIKDKTFYDLYDMPTYEELLAQQKEFIKYLEDDLKENYRDMGYRHNIFREILDKYEEIIGSDSNE